MATDEEATAAGFALPQGNDLISLGDNAITTNAKAATDILNKLMETLPWKGALLSSANVNNLADGIYKVNATRDNLTAKGLPPRLGNLLNFTNGSGGFTQLMVTAHTANYPLEIWARASDGLGAEIEPNFQRIHPPVRATRTTGVPLTFPRGSDTDTRTLLQVRVPFRFPVDVPRGRVIFRNYDYKSDTPYPGIVSFQGIAIGKHQMNEYGSMTGLIPEGEDPQILRGSFDSPADASSFGTPWQNIDLKAGQEYLLTFAYTVPEGMANHFALGTCFTNAILGSWVRTGVTTSVYQGFCPFSIHLEISVDAETPVEMFIGDSMLPGLNSHRPGRDSWAHAYMEEKGGIAQIIGQPGGSLAEYTNPATPKLRMMEHLGQPDKVHLALGFNDIGNGSSLATMKSRLATAVETIRAKYNAPLHLTTIQPRAIDPTFDAVRLPYNDYLRTLPHNAVMVSDHHAAVVDPLTGKTDARWQASPGDSHLNKPGYRRLAQATAGLTVQVPRDYTLDNTTGRVVKIWDHENNREQLIYGYTGVRDVSALTTGLSGQVLLSRDGNNVTLEFNNVSPTSAGLTDFMYLPQGFRIGRTTYRWLQTTARGMSRSFQLYASGNSRINSADPSDTFRQSFTFPTLDPWPTSLPGSAA